ncbi:MAG: glycosyltransferase [Flavobacterium sp.]|nr:MAG: glycosyltransferase [Flavobacterium sp.]
MPVYNDWLSFSLLIKNIAAIYKGSKFIFEIVAINDGSNDIYEKQPHEVPVEIVSLKLNVGHQRAIAIGLQYIFQRKSNFDFVVVMDSDGEDKPEHIISLVEKCNAFKSQKIIFAQRKKRQESALFKVGYFFYRNMFFFLTGQKINFGNFSCIPKSLLKRVAIQDNLWNHYSGSIIQSRTPFDRVLLDRGKRYQGVSKMNFTSLILHGLSSISVYFDSLSIRILKLSLLGVALCFCSVLWVLYIKFFTDTSVPGWASYLIMIIFSIIIQLFSVTLVVLLMQLSSRKNIKSPSAEVYNDFIETIETE